MALLFFGMSGNNLTVPTYQRHNSFGVYAGGGGAPHDLERICQIPVN